MDAVSEKVLKRERALKVYAHYILGGIDSEEISKNEEIYEEFEKWFAEICSYPHISTNVRKLGSLIPTINLPAGITCREDAPCSKSCYAKRGNFAYVHVVSGIMKNYYSYLIDPDHYFSVIDMTLKMAPYSFMRWHSSGDIIDSNYLDNMCKIARKHRTTKFLCFTKKYELVNAYVESNHRIPNNLTIVFSNWGSFLCENPHNFPTAWVKFKKEHYLIPSNARECPLHCSECVLTENSCWHMKKKDCVVLKHH